MAVALVAFFLQIVAALCFVPVMVHAFRRSVGTGFMVLCLPIYTPYYAFSQFEHRYKGMLLAGWLGGFVVAMTLRLIAVHLGVTAMPT
jgi:translocator protein